MDDDDDGDDDAVACRVSVEIVEKKVVKWVRKCQCKVEIVWCEMDASRRGSHWASAVGWGIVRRGKSSLSITYPMLLSTGSQENRCIWVDAAQFPWGWGTTICCPPRMLLLRKRETDAREQEHNKRKKDTKTRTHKKIPRNRPL